MEENDVNNDLRVEIKLKLDSLSNDSEDNDVESESDEGNDENFMDKWDALNDTQILALCHGLFSFCSISQ